MKAGCKAVLAIVLGLAAGAATAQHRYFTEALVGIDRIPVVVNDFEQAQDTWRRLGFLLKRGAAGQDGVERVQVKFDDGAGIDLVGLTGATDETALRYGELLAQGEGATGLSFYARDLGLFAATLRGSRFDFGSVSGTFAAPPGLDYLAIVQDSRAANDAAWLKHPNGATALSRVWIAASRTGGRNLQRLLAALNAEVTGAKVFAPEDVQSTVATVVNGEVLILPSKHQLLEDRAVIGVTFEVESLAVLRRRLADMGIPFAVGGAQDQSLVVAPAHTHGLWIEFRE